MNGVKSSHNYNLKRPAESCKNTQLHYQDKHLRIVKTYFCNLLKIPLFFVFRTSYHEFSLFMQQHKLNGFKKAKYSAKLAIQRYIESPGEYQRRSFL